MQTSSLFEFPKAVLKIAGKLASNVKQSQSLPLLTFNADIKSLDKNKITTKKKSKVYK